MPHTDLRLSLRPVWTALLLAGALSALSNLLYLVPTLYMLEMYDRVLPSHSEATLVFASLAAAGGVAFLSLFEWARTHALLRLGLRFDRAVAPPILAQLADPNLAQHLDRRDGMRDLESVRGALTGAGAVALLDLPWTLIFTAVAFLFHPLLGGLTLAAMVVLLILAVWNERLVTPLLDGATAAARAGQQVQDALARHTPAVRAMGFADAVVGQSEGLRHKALGLQNLASGKAAAMGGFIKALRLMMQSGALGVGAYLVMENQITPGSMFAATILVARALQPVDQAVGAWKSLATGIGAWGRLSRLLAVQAPGWNTTRLPAPTGAVALEGVLFRPAGGDHVVLGPLTFEVPAGRHVGVVGPSGSGKSTLGKMLVGALRPTRGTVRLDGADLAQQDPAHVGPHVGYLPQDIDFLPGSVRANIARFTDGPDSAVVAAATAADAHKLILRLPQGYDTPIGPGGHPLSGGQKQRLALARALFGNPRLLVLDEPNSNLDAEGDVALERTLAALRAQGVTVFVIAHRPSVLQGTDYLFVVGQGHIEAHGPTAKLLPQLTGAPVQETRHAPV